MKKKLITTLITFTTLVLLRADAGMVVLDYNGPTVVNQTSIERSFLINSNDGGEYDIAFRPLDTVVRSTDGKYTIPLENFFINNNREDIYFRFNEYSTIFNRLEMGGLSHSLYSVLGYSITTVQLLSHRPFQKTVTHFTGGKPYRVDSHNSI